MKNLLYYILNFTFPKFEKKIINILKNENNLVIFDVGCFKGVFVNTILKLIKNKKYRFYLFDINKNVKNYIKNLLKIKNINFTETALTNYNGVATYNFNSSFESSGSSLSSVFKDDSQWNFSRKLILKILSPTTMERGFLKQKVKTTTLDTFVKKNKIKKIDILKVDVDGSEYEFLKGSELTLKKNKIKTILIEISEKKKFYKNKEKKVIKFLNKKNFSLIDQSNIFSVSILSKTKSGDYLFVNNKILNESQVYE